MTKLYIDHKTVNLVERLEEYIDDMTTILPQ